MLDELSYLTIGIVLLSVEVEPSIGGINYMYLYAQALLTYIYMYKYSSVTSASWWNIKCSFFHYKGLCTNETIKGVISALLIHARHVVSHVLFILRYRRLKDERSHEQLFDTHSIVSNVLWVKSVIVELEDGFK